jgi:uncharacterized membrane protein YgaE (UPF0421/DUF939 family)
MDVPPMPNMIMTIRGIISIAAMILSKFFMTIGVSTAAYTVVNTMTATQMNSPFLWSFRVLKNMVNIFVPS